MFMIHIRIHITQWEQKKFKKLFNLQKSYQQKKSKSQQFQNQNKMMDTVVVLLFS